MMTLRLLLTLSLATCSWCDSICYDDLGCFDNEGVWAGRGLPQSPEVIAARFVLFTRSSEYETELIFNKSGILRNSDFDASRARTIVLIHGFADGCYQPWSVEVKTALLEKEDANVICLDWSLGSARYDHARDNARLVGALAERMINWIGTETGLRVDQLYLIGHDVGAHAAGYVSNRLQKVPRITGLDPAALDFDGADSVVRLDASDAVLVDVISTDASGSSNLGLGTTEESGRVNFKPNGGFSQPGCRDNISHYIYFLSGLRTLRISKDDWLEAACSHFRSADLFIESIASSCNFISIPCTSWDDFTKGLCPARCHYHECQSMGYNANSYPNNGTFYLLTESEPPFCDAFDSIEVNIASGQQETSGSLVAGIVTPDDVVKTITVVDGEMQNYDIFRANFVDEDIRGGVKAVQLTYTRDSAIFHSYSKTLQLDKVEVSVLDGNMELNTYTADGAILETGVQTTLNLVIS